VHLYHPYRPQSVQIGISAASVPRTQPHTLSAQYNSARIHHYFDCSHHCVNPTATRSSVTVPKISIVGSAFAARKKTRLESQQISLQRYTMPASGLSPINTGAANFHTRFFDDRSDEDHTPTPTSSTALRPDNSPSPETYRQGPSAAFLKKNDPSTRKSRAIDDLVRLRHSQAEFAPVKLTWNQDFSSSGNTAAASTTHLLAGMESEPASRALSRNNSVTSSILDSYAGHDFDDEKGSSNGGHDPYFSPSSSSSPQMSQKKKRPVTRYEDFLAGQNKLQTTNQTNRYDIMPDIVLLLNNFEPEKDDSFHDPGSKAPRLGDARRIADPKGLRQGSFTFLSARGLLNASALVIILAALLILFGIYPIVTQVILARGGSNFYTNATGQVPSIQGFRGLIDQDTPTDVYARTGYDGKEYQLVFSDEFEHDGRTFNEGDDPYWTALDSHYYATNNMEYYDPRGVSTAGGALVINMTEQNPRTNHGFNYSSGMIQTWNQFCFTGGYIEVAINLPGRPDVVGFWPGAWTMGNLGRAGFGATNEGNWPYSYDSCDIGTLKNQTDPVTGGPPAVHYSPYIGDAGLSYLPGQKFSSCACKDSDHPGPWLEDEGRYRGRGAPEIDILEATVEERANRGMIGTVSQTAQFAPFDAEHQWHNASEEDFELFPDVYNAHVNPYKGSVLQESVSCLPDTDQVSYSLVDPTHYQVYGFEYLPSQYKTETDVPFVTFQQGGSPTFTLKEPGMRPNNLTQIGQRLIADEPMYAILNFGMSPNFGTPDLENLVFPAIMKVDYIRIYQRTDLVNIGCNPPDYPTTDYIEKHLEAYTNANLTLWEDYTDSGFPKNSLVDTC